MTSGSVIHRSISDNGVIEIVQDQSYRSLYFGSDARQSTMDMLQPELLVLSYTQAMMACLLFNPEPANILLIGLGGGSLVKFILHHLPMSKIDVVESREDVVKLAYGYFCLPTDERLTISIEDGFDYLTRNEGCDSYDLILVDAFNHDGVSDSVKARHFFDVAFERLNQDGLLVTNLWNHKNDHFNQTAENLAESFGKNILMLPVKDKGNVIVFSAKNSLTFKSVNKLKNHAHTLENRIGLNFSAYLRSLRRNNRWHALGKLF